MCYLFCLVLFGFFIGAVISEICFRLYITKLDTYPQKGFDNIIHQYADDIELIFEHKPSSSTLDGAFVTNAFGLRDYEYTLNKPDDVYRIALLGDSVSVGAAVAVDKTFENLLEQKLNKQLNHKIEILNFGVTNYNSRQENYLLHHKVLQFNPDLIILEYCMNDDQYSNGLAKGLVKELHPKSLGSRLHSKVLTYLLHRNAQKNFDNWRSFDNGQKLFESLVSLKKERNIDSFIVIFPMHFWENGEYEHASKHTEVKELAKKAGLHGIDLLPVWRKLSLEKRRDAHADRIHLSESGMKIVSESLYDYLLLEFKLPQKLKMPAQ